MSKPTAAPRLFSTCPPSSASGAGYTGKVLDVARWSEDYGFEGILVYTDNSLVDPWLVSQLIVEQTRELCPLVAVQPVYMHPYAVAKMVTSLAHLHGRRVHLNMVAGGFKNDLQALGDPTPHDRRYARLVEFTTIVERLLTGVAPVSVAGEFYAVENLRLTPSIPADLLPEIFISGSSDAGRAAAAELGALAVEYPQPAAEYASRGAGEHRRGLRIGVIAREDPEEAWRIAHSRFPPDRKGQLTHQLAMKTSDSAWHRQLSDLARKSASADHSYWLFPFENYKTFCPYLVGSDEQVAEEIAGYLQAGYQTFILDVPIEAADLEHTRRVFQRAESLVTR